MTPPSTHRAASCGRDATPTAEAQATATAAAADADTRVADPDAERTGPATAAVPSADTAPAADRCDRAATVVVPTYNEAETVLEVIRGLREALAAVDAELLVVDDDSPDGTAGLVAREYASADEVRVICRPHESGLASAIQCGFREGRGAVCAVLDADGQHPPSAVAELLAGFESGVDVVVGSRNLPAGGIENWSRRRRLISLGGTLLSKASVVQTRGLTDPMSGLFAVRRSLVAGRRFEPRGFKLLPEILARADVASDRVREVPYVFRPRRAGDSKLSADQYGAFCSQLAVLGWIGRGFDRLLSPARAAEAARVGALAAGAAVLNLVLFASSLAAQFSYPVAGLVAFTAAPHHLLARELAPVPTVAVPRQLAVPALGGAVWYLGSLVSMVEFADATALTANALAVVSAALIVLGLLVGRSRERSTA